MSFAKWRQASYVPSLQARLLFYPSILGRKMDSALVRYDLEVSIIRVLVSVAHIFG